MTNDTAPVEETYALKMAMLLLIIQFAARQPDPKQFTRDFFDDCIRGARQFSFNSAVDAPVLQEAIVERLQDMQVSVENALGTLKRK